LLQFAIANARIYNNTELLFIPLSLVARGGIFVTWFCQLKGTGKVTLELRKPATKNSTLSPNDLKF
jgi:hypothetical protein